MPIKIRWWCDSGANIHSMREGVITPEDLMLSDEEWKEMDDELKEDLMRDVCLERLDWGWTEE